MYQTLSWRLFDSSTAVTSTGLGSSFDKHFVRFEAEKDRTRRNGRSSREWIFRIH